MTVGRSLRIGVVPLFVVLVALAIVLMVGCKDDKPKYSAEVTRQPQWQGETLMFEIRLTPVGEK